MDIQQPLQPLHGSVAVNALPSEQREVADQRDGDGPGRNVNEVLNRLRNVVHRQASDARRRDVELEAIACPGIDFQRAP
jgi:hypothetical protein